ncbi:MAG: DUF86 domain-containing protein [Candidatus Lokiarchaeota archaeon]|nr:DUF86 domain-containing protein [Candidatus Lokiarchaeota archaeon]
MKNKGLILLEHIFESISLLNSYIEGKTKEDFINSIQLQDSIIRRIQIIGEAIKIIPINIKNLNPKIPWRKIAAMRDLLIHQYFNVDLDLTWQVIIRTFRN